MTDPGAPSTAVHRVTHPTAHGIGSPMASLGTRHLHVHLAGLVSDSAELQAAGPRLSFHFALSMQCTTWEGDCPRVSGLAPGGGSDLTQEYVSCGVGSVPFYRPGEAFKHSLPLVTQRSYFGQWPHILSQRKGKVFPGFRIAWHASQ